MAWKSQTHKNFSSLITSGGCEHTNSLFWKLVSQEKKIKQFPALPVWPVLQSNQTVDIEKLLFIENIHLIKERRVKLEYSFRNAQNIN